MLRACEYCVGRGEKVFGHYDRTEQQTKNISVIAQKNRSMTDK